MAEREALSEKEVSTTTPSHKVVSTVFRTKQYKYLRQYCEKEKTTPGAVLRKATLAFLLSEGIDVSS